MLDKELLGQIDEYLEKNYFEYDFFIKECMRLLFEGEEIKYSIAAKSDEPKDDNEPTSVDTPEYIEPPKLIETQHDAFVRAVEKMRTQKEFPFPTKFPWETEEDDSFLAKANRKISALFDHSGDTFAQRLWRLIKQKGVTDVDVYKKAHLDRRIFSKIRNEKDYMPSKRTILAIIVGLELDLAEANDLLKRAGYYLSETIKEDMVLQYFIENHNYDMFTINEVLDYYGLPLLGDGGK